MEPANFKPREPAEPSWPILNNFNYRQNFQWLRILLKKKRGNAIHHLSVYHRGGVHQHQGRLQPAPGVQEVHQDQDPVVPVLDVPVPAGSDSSALPDINDGCPVASTGVYYNVVAAVGSRNTTTPGDQTPFNSGTASALPFQSGSPLVSPFHFY